MVCLCFRNDRVTIQERERLHEENEVTEEKTKKIVEERKKYSTKVCSSPFQYFCLLCMKNIIDIYF